MNSITNLTRQKIIDGLTNRNAKANSSNTLGEPFCMWGRLSPVEFLNRLYPLKDMESYDSRYENAETDIHVHTIVNPNDYPEDWVFEDERFPLKNGSDNDLLDFLCEIFHPEVINEQSNWKEIFENISSLISFDGYEFYVTSHISGRAIYSWRKKGKTLFKISREEIGTFVRLFNHGGYVLDFTTNSFNDFTQRIVGIPLCNHYGLSKAKSLIKFTEEFKEEDIIKLLLALFDYYMGNKPFDYERDIPEKNSEIQKCLEVTKRLKNNITNITNNVIEELKDHFSSSYMTAQLDLMERLQKGNPTEAIGKAKELIESCCKTILEDDNITIDPKWSVNALVDETLKHLKITPKDIPDTIQEASSIKAILGNLKAIATNMANLRNRYGSGHGRPASFKGLEERHAKLAVGSAAVLVEFLWTTHQRMK